MPKLMLGTGEEQRGYGKLPRLRLRNMLLEPDKSNSIDGIARLQRPGLAPFIELPGSATNAVWQQAGTFGGDHLVLSDATLYRVTAAGVPTALGAILPQRAQIAASADRALIAAGGVAYSTDGASVVPVTMPNGESVSSVAFISGFFVLVVEGTQRFFWIEPGQVNPDALSFAEAERSPDPIVSAGVVGDELWFNGGASEEVWVLTGDIDAPFQRITGRIYESGMLARDTLVEVDTQLIWVTADYQVVVSRGSPQQVSTPAISEHLRLADPGQMRAWYFKFDTHVFYVLTTGRDTFAYDIPNQTWSRFSSLGSEAWRAHLGAAGVCGDSQSGKLWKLDPARSNDDGVDMLREITGGLEIIGAPVRCDSLAMRVAAGWAAQPGFEPAIEFCWSDDEGNTWSGWRRLGLGTQGRYNAPVVARKLGLLKRPGRLFWFRMTDDALLRISYATINEAVG